MTDKKPQRGRGRPPVLTPEEKAARAAARSTATTRRSREGRVLRTLYLDADQAARVERLQVQGGHRSVSALVEAAVEAVTRDA